MRKPFLILLIITGLFLLFFWIYFPTLSRYREIKMEEEALIGQLEDLNQKIEDLARERELLRNDVAHLEKVIREELGLVKPGEVVYKFLPEESEKAEVTGFPAGQETR